MTDNISPQDIIDAKLNPYFAANKFTEKLKAVLREVALLGFNLGKHWRQAKLSNKLDQLIKDKLINQHVYKTLKEII